MFLNHLVLLILYAVLQQDAVVAHNTKNVVCYHRSWSAYHKSLGKFDVATDLDPFLCTHLVYASFDIEETGELKAKDSRLDLVENNGRGNIRKFNDLKLRNRNLKTLLSVGGWYAGSKNFSIVAANQTKRTTFLQTSIKLLRKHGFNGLDIDWVYPINRHNLTNNDRDNFVILLKELQEGFKPFGLILTAILTAPQFMAERYYKIAEMAKYLDLINVMSYNLNGAWNPMVGINAPLYAGPSDTTEIAKQRNFDAIAKYWINQGAPRDKLVMGVPFFGRSYTLENPNNHDVGANHTGFGIGGQYTGDAGILAYYELCETFQKNKTQWHLKWEPSQMVPYAYNGDQWIGYDNERSISLKIDYVKHENLGGIMIWSMESDDFRGICGSKRYPLLKLINESLFGTISNRRFLFSFLFLFISLLIFFIVNVILKFKFYLKK